MGLLWHKFMIFLNFHNHAFCLVHCLINSSSNLKMLCPYLLGQNCLHLTFKPYLSSETYSRKNEKLPNIVIHACKDMTEKNCWKCLARKLGFVYFLSWHVGAVVTHPLWMQDVRVQFPAPARFFMFDFLFCCCCVFTFCP